VDTPAASSPSLRTNAALSWRYPPAAVRDERLDFIRGFACVSFVAAHFEAFTWFNFLFWERLGIFSGAELFVIVSGLLLGITHREVIDRSTSPTSTERLWRRAGKLYLAYVALIAVVALVRAAGVIDTSAVTTFTDRWAAITYPLYPPEGTPLLEHIKSILLMRSTPHQVQILGFYICVLLLAPLALWQLKVGRLWLVVTASWAVYLFERKYPLMLTGAQFEHGFPLLAWQVYVVNALAVGYHARYELPLWLAKHPWHRPVVITLAALIALASFIFAQTTDNPSFPWWGRLDLIEPATFRAWYDAYFDKDVLDPLRLVTATAFFISFYALLTYWWTPAKRAFGPFLLPLGQNSLYVFLVHVIFIAAADQIPGYFEGVPVFDWQTIWLNTAVLAGILAGLWAMVRFRVLFGVIPR
jgi:hypothetical protein